MTAWKVIVYDPIDLLVFLATPLRPQFLLLAAASSGGVVAPGQRSVRRIDFFFYLHRIVHELHVCIPGIGQMCGLLDE